MTFVLLAVLGLVIAVPLVVRARTGRTKRAGGG